MTQICAKLQFVYKTSFGKHVNVTKWLPIKMAAKPRLIFLWKLKTVPYIVTLYPNATLNNIVHSYYVAMASIVYSYYIAVVSIVHSYYVAMVSTVHSYYTMLLWFPLYIVSIYCYGCHGFYGYKSLYLPKYQNNLQQQL